MSDSRLLHPSAQLWRVVMYCDHDPDFALEVVSPTDYDTAREYAKVLAEVLDHDMVVERVEEL